MLRSFLLVGAGGAAGSMLRYAIGLLLLRPAAAFPLATFLINIVGSAIIGALAGLATRGGSWMTGTGWPLLAIGLCGGFTTFSAFSLELLRLTQQGTRGTAVVYATLSLLAGVLACYGGYWLTLKK